MEKHKKGRNEERELHTRESRGEQREAGEEKKRTGRSEYFSFFFLVRS